MNRLFHLVQSLIWAILKHNHVRMMRWRGERRSKQTISSGALQWLTGHVEKHEISGGRKRRRLRAAGFYQSFQRVTWGALLKQSYVNDSLKTSPNVPLTVNRVPALPLYPVKPDVWNNRKIFWNETVCWIFRQNI